MPDFYVLGMVRTQVECVAGIDAMKSKHPNITENGPKGMPLIYCRVVPRGQFTTTLVLYGNVHMETG